MFIPLRTFDIGDLVLAAYIINENRKIITRQPTQQACRRLKPRPLRVTLTRGFPVLKEGAMPRLPPLDRPYEYAPRLVAEDEEPPLEEPKFWGLNHCIFSDAIVH